MTDWGQFEEKSRKRLTECELCEAMCPDAVDGTLSEPERKVFERHVAGCVACAREYEEAQRGAAWLGMLKGHTPEPPAQLLAKILAETTAQESAVSSPEPEWAGAPVAPPIAEQAPAWALTSLVRRAFGALRLDSTAHSFQPRLAMTAAMAFFSIAMTLSMTGVRLQDMRWSDLTPSGIRRTVANASATAERSIQNVRVVYQVESRVSELRGQGPLAARDVQYTGEQQEPASANSTQRDHKTQPEQGNAHYKPL
ncbi:MAG TPA: zf-HC2 domain-containing protein [Acidobacteriaceae bacterium]|nr:zf-HC2 domain-containing protein [Acidobacteriaceae bacterium]